MLYPNVGRVRHALLPMQRLWNWGHLLQFAGHLLHTLPF